MHPMVPSNWSRSIGAGGRDPSERVVTIAGMRMQTVLRYLRTSGYKTYIVTREGRICPCVFRKGLRHFARAGGWNIRLR